MLTNKELMQIDGGAILYEPHNLKVYIKAIKLIYKTVKSWF